MKTQQDPYRLLCMDGGGIFGYFTVLMLKRFAEKHPTFLQGHNVSAFAGTSAGALISLLLARHDNPRDYLLSGALDSFFASDLLHGNTLDTFNALGSYFGLTTWCGGKDMERLLKSEFGDMTLGDLPHKVLIMTFDISGHTDTQALGPAQRRWKTKVYHNFPSRGNDLDVPAWFVAYGAACPVTVRPVIDGITDGGIYAMSPTLSAVSQLLYIAKLKAAAVEAYQREVARLYVLDLAEGEDHLMLSVTMDDGIRMVALSQNSVVMRLTRQGGMTEENLEAYKKHVAFLRRIVEAAYRQNALMEDEEYAELLDLFGPETLPEDELACLKRIADAQRGELKLLGMLTTVLIDPLHRGFELEPGGEANDPMDPVMLWRAEVRQIHALLVTLLRETEEAQHPVLRTLNQTQALSLGVGNEVPSFCLPNFNLGFTNFNMVPTNPAQNVWTPAAFHLLYSPSTDHTDYQSRQFMGANYHRCSPPVIGWPTPPVVLSLYLARFRAMRAFILQGIRNAMGKAEPHMDECEAWMRTHGWID